MLYIKHPVLNLHVMLLILEKRRLDLRVKEHGDKNDNCCIFRHSVDAGQTVTTLKLLLQEIKIHTLER